MEKDIEYTSTGALIRDGISFEEWQIIFSTAAGIQRGANWWLGDLLSVGEDRFPEKWSQVLDAKFAEAHRGLLRVSRRIPISIRRADLSWSAHREAASPESMEERIELLDLAEANGWGAREISAEVRRRKEARRGNGGPPIEENESETEVGDNPVPFLSERDRIIAMLDTDEARFVALRAVEQAPSDAFLIAKEVLAAIIGLIRNSA